MRTVGKRQHLLKLSLPTGAYHVLFVPMQVSGNFRLHELIDRMPDEIRVGIPPVSAAARDRFDRMCRPVRSFA